MSDKTKGLYNKFDVRRTDGSSEKGGNPTIGGTMKIEVSEEQLDAMVNRFLAWRLPKPWNPDNGISYARPNYAHEPADHDWPTGTNLFDAHQARQMVLHILGDDA